MTWRTCTGSRQSAVGSRQSAVSALVLSACQQCRRPQTADRAGRHRGKPHAVQPRGPASDGCRSATRLPGEMRRPVPPVAFEAGPAGSPSMNRKSMGVVQLRAASWLHSRSSTARPRGCRASSRFATRRSKLTRSFPGGCRSMPVTTPSGAITLRSSAVVAPCITPISTRLRRPEACRVRHARSAGVVCVSAPTRPSRYRAYRTPAPFQMFTSSAAGSLAAARRHPPRHPPAARRRGSEFLARGDQDEAESADVDHQRAAKTNCLVHERSNNTGSASR